MNATINLREVMEMAWHEARHQHFARRMPAGTLRSLFPAALRWAWKQVRTMSENRARIAARKEAELIALAPLSDDDLLKGIIYAEVQGDVTEAHRLRGLLTMRQERTIELPLAA